MASRPISSKEQNKNIEDELDHQIKKSKLLDADRTAFYVNAEETKKVNNQMIEDLKKEIKELKKLRDELMANKRATTPGTGATGQTAQAFQWGGEIRDEKFWRRKTDDEIHSTKILKDRLLQLQDKLNEVTDTKFGGHEESALMRNIRILENRLDKVMIKFNEAQSIKKTYEQIVKRLKEERVGYDNQLAAIERSLKGKEHDFEELLLLAHDATHAKELAQAELKKYEHKKAAVRELRKNYLDEKWKGINAKEAAIQKLEINEKDQPERIEKQQMNQNLSPMANEQQMNMDANLQKQKLADYQEAFRKLYEATGVTDVNEIIQKFKTQDETRKQLNDLQQDNSEKIEQLQNESIKLKNELNDLKYEGGETLTRKQIDEIENNVSNAINKCERAKVKYERSSKILVNAKAGIEHLVEKLDFFKVIHYFFSKINKLDGKPNLIVTDDSLIEALDQCVQKMKEIYRIVTNDSNFKKEDLGQLSFLNNITFQGVPKLFLVIFQHIIWLYMIKVFLLQLYQQLDANIEGFSKNIRVKLPDKDDDDVSDGEIDDDIDQELIQKLKEKYASQQRAEKQKQKGKKKA